MHINHAGVSQLSLHDDTSKFFQVLHDRNSKGIPHNSDGLVRNDVMEIYAEHSVRLKEKSFIRIEHNLYCDDFADFGKYPGLLTVPFEEAD